jgi:hypothetical protein
MQDTPTSGEGKVPELVRLSGSTILAEGIPLVVLDRADAEILFTLATVTEHRTDNAHDTLVRVGRWLDENAPCGGHELFAIATRAPDD